MGAKIVSYDVDQTVQSPTRYEDIHAALESYRYHARVTESCWVIDTRESCNRVYIKLMSILNNSDRLFVADLGENSEYYNIIDEDAFG